MDKIKKNLIHHLNYTSFSTNDISQYLKWFDLISDSDIIVEECKKQKIPIKFSKTTFPYNIDKFYWYCESYGEIMFIAHLEEDVYCFFNLFHKYENSCYKPYIYLTNSLESLINSCSDINLLNNIKKGSRFPNYNNSNNESKSSNSKEF